MALLANKNTDGEDRFTTDFHFPTSKKALLIFTRNPELGKCKTRLAATVGDEKALEIYVFLLKHTVEITKSLAVDKFVFYSENVQKEDLWDAEIFRKKAQSGDDLGFRMENAFAEMFQAGYEKVIVIGSDMYDLSKTDIDNAFDALNTNDLVIGPAEDGGYYLLGMKQVHKAVFKNKIWGTNTILEDTLKDLQNKTVAMLEERNDVDYYEDIKDIAIFKQFIN
ncbi:TIGR04282 family arsenosugar biosynthesis glycosyltransferase [Ulvibacter litoralis]|uniref:Glycosyltransferase n=1 Tax=Ulvibacter litoralis TaxID=227084 RepID=A0A1G7CK09_9FLAO|nr:TIGR04282 family arsenosugar biosynthesis glycosyltransferase [Ulvibacter litoralis]GHC47332.1 hypothetical protein GCM10008083_08180 [Ulvibacter litoralis]SDE38765.1 hypothetical protein SAMN05421855_101377 [Ulvibacter litoralis]